MRYTLPERVLGDSPNTIEDSEDKLKDINFEGGLVWNSAIHFPSKESHELLFWDAVKECFKVMPMPPIQGNGLRRNIIYFGESDGHLHLIDFDCHGSLTEFDVFEMEKDYSMWFVKYHVDLEVITAQFSENIFSNVLDFYVLSLICREFGEKSVLVLYLHCPDGISGATSKAISYQLGDDDHTCKKLCDLDIEDRLNGLEGLVHQYIENPF